MKRRLWIWFLCLALIYLQYRLWFSQHGLLYLWSLEADIKEQTIANQKSEKCNQYLADEIMYFRKNPDALEERARFELNMVKDNEVFVNIEDSSDKTPKDTIGACDILE